MSEAQHRQVTALVNDIPQGRTPLHGLQRAVRKEAGATGTLVALLTSGIAIAIGRYVVAGVG